MGKMPEVAVFAGMMAAFIGACGADSESAVPYIVMAAGAAVALIGAWRLKANGAYTD